MSIFSKEIGGTGTEIYGGIIIEDYNNKLEFPKSVDVFDQMRKGDATVRQALSACKLPIRSAKYFFEEASEDARDVEIKEFCEKVFFEYIDWNYFLNHTLLSLDFGFSVFEKVFAVKEDKIIFKKIAPRLPKSIQSWITQDSKAGITQYANKKNKDGTFDGGDIISIPKEKLFIITFDKEGDNIQGVSILRSAYKHWYFKEKLYVIQGISAERTGAGIPVATRTEAGQITTDEENVMQSFLKNMRANESAHAIVPYGWKFEIMNQQGGGFGFTEAILHHDREIVKSVLAQFLELGVTKGSLNLSVDQTSLFYQSLKTITEIIIENIQNELVKQIVDLNFDNVEDYPKLKVSDIGKINLDEISTAIQRFSQSGVLTPTEDIERHIRKISGLPDLPEDFEEIKEKMREENKPIQKEEIKEDKIDEKKDEENEEIKDEKLSKEKKKYYRPLTLAEEKINLSNWENFFDKNVAKLAGLYDKFAKKQIEIIKKEIQEDKSYSKEKTENKKEFKKLLKPALLGTFDFGKTEGWREAGEDLKSRPPTPSEKKELADFQAEAIAQQQLNDAENDVKLATSEQIGKGLALATALAFATQRAKEKAQKQGNIFGSISTSGYTNQGLDFAFKKTEKKIWGYQYSAILDGKTSNICLSLDGRVSTNASDIPTPPLHAGCRQRKVAIYKEQTIKPEINKPPKSVIDGIGQSIFDTKQPKKVI